MPPLDHFKKIEGGNSSFDYKVIQTSASFSGCGDWCVSTGIKHRSCWCTERRFEYNSPWNPMRDWFGFDHFLFFTCKIFKISHLIVIQQFVESFNYGVSCFVIFEVAFTLLIQDLQRDFPVVGKEILLITPTRKRTNDLIISPIQLN